MADLNNITPMKGLPPFLQYFRTIGIIPSSYKVTMTYEEQVLELMRFIKDEIIPKINENVLATQELQEKFKQLVTYVDKYFENLDIQEEVNIKLNEMAESGELAEIITQYVQLQGLLCFNTLNDLKNAENLINGSFVKTFGKISYNDGMGEFYKIRNITTEDIIDEINIIKINNSNSLIAELIPNKQINEILTDISIINNDLNNLEINKVSNIYGASSNNNLVWRQYFIDNVDGIDTNDGTELNPFKTLQPIINLINKGKLKIDIALKRGQTHLLPSTTFNGCVIHINVYGDGNDRAIITTNQSPNINSSVVFYNCHANFNDVVFQNIGYDMYFDGGSFVAQNCIFDCKFTSWGCGCRFNNCTIKTLKTRMCNMWIQNQSIIGCIDSKASIFYFEQPIFFPQYAINHETQSCYDINGGEVSISGVTSINTDSSPARERLFWFLDLVFCLSAAPNVTTTGSNFTATSKMACCKVVSTNTRLNALYNSANGIDYIDGSEYPTT